jgi:hypothetical protein
MEFTYLTPMRCRYLFYSSVAFALTGCNLVAGKCTYEIRSLDAAGLIGQPGAPFASAQLSMSEQRGSLQGASINWMVTSDALKGHVLSASFKDSSSPTQVKVDLPLAAADRPEITSGSTGTREGTNLSGVRGAITANHAVIELQTDDSSQPTVTIPLTPGTVGDWIRPYCS